MASAAPAVVRRSVHFSDSLSQSTKDKKLFKAKRENETLKSEKAKLARELKTARRQHNSAAPPSEDVANLSEQVAVLREQVDELRTLFLSSGVSNSTPSRTASAAAAPAMSVAEQEFADFRAHKKLEKERATEMKRLKAMTACMKPLIQDVMKDCMTHTRCASSHHTAALPRPPLPSQPLPRFRGHQDTRGGLAPTSKPPTAAAPAAIFLPRFSGHHKESTSRRVSCCYGADTRQRESDDDDINHRFP